MWNDNDKKILEIFDNINGGDVPPFECPVCKKHSGHLYMYRWKQEKKGSIWVWCSSCRASAHERVLLPDWWKNALVIDENLLGVHPDMLEDNKKFVDEYVKLLLEGETPDQNTQEFLKAKYKD